MGNLQEYTEEQLHEKAQDVFDFHEDALHLFATSDGNFFLPKDEGAYKYHLHKNQLKGYVIERPHVLVGELDEDENEDEDTNHPSGEPEAQTETPVETPKAPADAPAGEGSTGSGTEGV